MRIAINGCGVAGPALAWWLGRAGHDPVIFETAAERRSGGYVIDFWADGYDIAARMGLIPRLSEAGYVVERLDTYDSAGRRTTRVPGKVFQALTDGRYLSIARSDLAAVVHDACGGVETRFGCSVTALEDRGDRVEAGLSDGSRETFDLVIGADGLHSKVRELVFGPEERFEQHLAYHVAAVTLDGYRPRDELVYVSHTVPGRQVARFSMRGDRTLVLFVFASHLMGGEPRGAAEVRAMLRQVYGGMGWETPAILERIGDPEDMYFDRVSQIRMSAWSKGRVALAGDAAACASLLAGEGTGLAMVEAYVLAGELSRAGGDHVAAFAGYEMRLRDHLAKKQKNARSFAGFFAPKNNATLFLRDWMLRLTAVPFLARLMLGGMLMQKIELPDYGL